MRRTTRWQRWVVLALSAVMVLVACSTSAIEDAGSPRSTHPDLRLRTTWSAPGPYDPSVLTADSDGVVSVGAIGDVRYYDTAGHERWNVDLLNMPVYWRPALGPDAVVVSLGDRVVVLERSTGDIRWQRGLADPGRVAIGAGSDGVETVVITTGDGYVSAFRAGDAALRWSYQHPGGGLVAASISLGDGRAYVTFPAQDQGHLFAIDLASGRVLWSQPIASHAAEPVIVPGVVVLAERLVDGSRVRALDAATGALKWSVPVSGTFLPGYAAATGGGEYAVATDEGRVLLVDLGTQAVRWTAKVGWRSANLITVLLVDRRVLVTADGHGLVTIDRRDGRVHGRVPDRGILRAAAGMGTMLYTLVGVGLSGVVTAWEA